MMPLEIPFDNRCGCFRCQDERAPERANMPIQYQMAGPLQPDWRYACEICGNKRCPHHTDHRLACTGSNEPGQPGSSY
jgi:hypothetical protein